MFGWLVVTRAEGALYWQLRHVEDGIVSDASCGGCLSELLSSAHDPQQAAAGVGL